MPGREALILYKNLHRTVQRVFRGDIPAMLAARDKVCEEFNKNRNVNSETSIAELLNQGIQYCFFQLSFVILQPGKQVQEILDKSVVQIKKTEEDKFQMNIRDQTHMFDNNPFRDDVTPEEYKMANRRSRRKGGKCDDAKTD